MHTRTSAVLLDPSFSRARRRERADRRAHVPAANGVASANRLCLRGRYLDRVEERRHGHAAQLAAGRGVVPAFFARRDEDRLQRRLRRQHRRLRRQCERRRAGAPHLSPDGRPRDWLASRRQARAVCLEPRERPAAIQPVLSRRTRWRAAGEAAGALRRIRRDRPKRHGLRLHADVAGLPHVEALSRRLGAGPVALQSQDVRVAQPDERSRQRRAADVAREHDLLRVGSRRHRAQQHLGARRRLWQDAAGHAVLGLRSDVPVGRRRCDRVSGGRPLVSARLRHPRRRPRCRSAW